MGCTTHRQRHLGRLGFGVAMLAALVALATLSPAAGSEAERSGGGSRIASSLQPAGPTFADSFRDRVFEGSSPAMRAVRRSATTYLDQHGHKVAVERSAGYGPDPEADQALVDFLGSLLHAGEMNRLHVYVVTPEEMSEECGVDAVGCYYADLDLIVITGEEQLGGLSTRFVAAHEYGHHVANHRRNDPWRALHWGTKRWASGERVCSGTRRRRFFPGNEGAHYYQNPGEAFAEAFAKYHAEFRDFPWSWVPALAPYKPAYERIRRDVKHPWTGPSQSRYGLRLQEGERGATTLKVPRDGMLRIRLRSPRRADFDLYLKEPGRWIVKRSASRSARERIRYTVCGEGRLRIVVHAYRGSGRARVLVSKP